MKRHLLAFGLIALALNACGDGKKKGGGGSGGPTGPFGNNDFVVGPNGEIVLPGEDSVEEGYDCGAQSVSQSDDCGGYGPLPERSFRVIMKRSKRSNDFFGQGYVDQQNNSIEQCLRSLRISGESFDLSFQNMDLRNNGISLGARCQVEMWLAYKPGYRFAIRRVSASLLSDFAPGTEAGFKGIYGFGNQRPFIFGQSFKAPGRQINQIDRNLAPQELVWSDCNGRAQVEIDTAFALTNLGSQGPRGNWSAENNWQNAGSSSYNMGRLEMNPAQPYRFEVIWEACR